jgi:glycosyltransferase involved in cell wall biosynthesis
MLRSQGLTGPKVTARPLPTEAPNLSRQDVDKAREEFDVSLLPVVVVVGSHEPRKNHVVVLEAAESMWRSGHRFDLVFAGGSSWGGSTFVTYLQALAAEGFPVRMYERVNEQSLWALYGLAEFSVFPSLLEGYGLPIAESLASGTPVITSNHGSMAEVGKAGGVVLVDPRDSVKLASAMTSLLVDKELRDRLTGEARARVFPTWDQYSDSLWADLVGTATKSSELL